MFIKKLCVTSSIRDCDSGPWTGAANRDRDCGLRLGISSTWDIRYSVESNIRWPNIRWFEYSSIRSYRIFGHIEYLDIRLNRIFGQSNIRLPNIRLNRIFKYSVEPNIRCTEYSVNRITNIRISNTNISEYFRIPDIKFIFYVFGCDTGRQWQYKS